MLSNPPIQQDDRDRAAQMAALASMMGGAQPAAMPPAVNPLQAQTLQAGPMVADGAKSFSDGFKKALGSGNEQPAPEPTPMPAEKSAYESFQDFVVKKMKENKGG